MIRLALAVAAALAASQEPLFRGGVDAVRVDVSVMNGASPVAGLTADNFEITDNGVAQKIESVLGDTVLLHLTLLFDVSASMAGEPVHDLIAAGHGLVTALRRDDAVSLMTFSERVRLVIPLSKERPPVTRALDQLQAGGATSLHDAVYMALQLRREDPIARAVLLVFSDGHDTVSWLTAEQVRDAARRSGALIHVVERHGAVDEPNHFALELAQAGGGRRWSAASSRDLRELFGRVLNELRSRYLLTYYPAGPVRAGWHDVKVTLKRTRGEVTARPGYFVAK